MISEAKTSIAVVIPSFNVQDYISEAIESVLRQDPRPNEVIIINDGSTDRTRSIISVYESDPIVKIVDSENRGLGPARNLGLEMASSEYVYFFDSDDVMADEFMVIITDAIQRYKKPEMIVFSGESFFDSAEQFAFSPADYKRKIEGFFRSGPEMYRKLDSNRSLFSSACLYVTRRDVWARSGLRFKPIVHEDEEILLSLYLSVNRCCCLNDVLFYRRIRSGSIMTGGVTERNAQGMIQVIRSLIGLKKEHPNLVREHHDLWLARTRYMLVVAFARSIQSGKLLPNSLVLSALFQVFSPRLLMSIAKQYALAGKRFLTRI